MQSAWGQLIARTLGSVPSIVKNRSGADCEIICLGNRGLVQDLALLVLDM